MDGRPRTLGQTSRPRSAVPRRTSNLGIGKVVRKAHRDRRGRGQHRQGDGKGPKASHEPEVQVTLTGTVSATTAADGSVDYTIAAAGKTLKLEAGPKWFWGDKNPLTAFVGKSVTIVGEQSGDEVDVQTVDGKAIRAPGKPPWAGGWKVVGQGHPGWSQAKADRFKAKQAAKQAREQAKAACRAAGNCPAEADESEKPVPSP